MPSVRPVMSALITTLARSPMGGFCMIVNMFAPLSERQLSTRPSTPRSWLSSMENIAFLQAVFSLGANMKSLYL